MDKNKKLKLIISEKIVENINLKELVKPSGNIKKIKIDEIGDNKIIICEQNSEYDYE